MSGLKEVLLVYTASYPIAMPEMGVTKRLRRIEIDSGNRYYVYDLETGKRIDAGWSDEDDGIRIGAVAGLRFLGQSGLLMLAGLNGTVALYRLAPPELERVATWRIGGWKTVAADVSPDGQHVALAASGEPVKTWRIVGTRHSGRLRAGSAEYSQRIGWCKSAVCPATQRIALAVWGEKLEVRDVASGDKLATVDEPYVREMVWSRDGTHLLAVTPPDPHAPALGDFTSLRVFQTAAFSRRPQPPAAGAAAVNASAFTAPKIYDVGFPPATARYRQCTVPESASGKEKGPRGPSLHFLLAHCGRKHVPRDRLR
jgi:hypothetical protein